MFRFGFDLPARNLALRRRISAVAVAGITAIGLVGAVQPAAAESTFTVSPEAAPLKVTPHDFTAQQGLAQAVDLATIVDGGEAPSASEFTATVDWGDGTSAQTCTSTTTSCSIRFVDEGQFTVHSTGHAYAALGSYQVRVLVRDADGDVGDTAIGRPASQNNFWDRTWAPESAGNDGNTDGQWLHHSVAHTYGNAGQDWWQVDLGANLPISTVEAWNRTDCCDNRMSNFYILASATAIPSDLQSALNSICGTYTPVGNSCPGAQFQGPWPTPVSTFAMNVSARYVRLQLGGCCDPVNLAELVVHGPTWLTATVLENDNNPADEVLAPGPFHPAAAGLDSGSQVVATMATAFDDDYTAWINWGDGSSSGPAGVVRTATGYQFTGSHTYPREGAYTIRLTVLDGDGPPQALAYGVGVRDGLLSMQMNPNSDPFNWTTNVGNGDLLAVLSDSDAGSSTADFTGTLINWGDGSTPCNWTAIGQECGSDQFQPGSYFIGGGHLYTRPGLYTVTVSARDVAGARVSGTLQIRVTSPPLAVTPTSASITTTPRLGGRILATFTDPDGSLDPSAFSAVVVWGDGTSSPGVVSLVAGNLTVTAPQHVYAFTGIYTIRVTVRDSDGSAGVTQIRVTVSNTIPS